MKHYNVKSSNVKSIAHKGDVMHVTYKGSGKTYEFTGISSDQFNALKNAKSIGKHLNGMGIKGKLVDK